MKQDRHKTQDIRHKGKAQSNALKQGGQNAILSLRMALLLVLVGLLVCSEAPVFAQFKIQAKVERHYYPSCTVIKHLEQPDDYWDWYDSSGGVWYKTFYLGDWGYQAPPKGKASMTDAFAPGWVNAEGYWVAVLEASLGWYPPLICSWGDELYGGEADAIQADVGWIIQRLKINPAGMVRETDGTVLYQYPWGE